MLPGSRCKHCRGKLSEEDRSHNKRLHDSCVDAFATSFFDKQQRRHAKADRANTRARREAIKTIPQLIAKTQEAFNAYIRERDKDKPCFVCERPFDQNIKGRAIHAGHVRSRGAAGHLRFNEDNCLGECEGCNNPYGAKPHQIKAGAIKRIGEKRFAELEDDNTPHKWTREELIEIRDTYRAKARELKRSRDEAGT